MLFFGSLVFSRMFMEVGKVGCIFFFFVKNILEYYILFYNILFLV